MSTTTVYVTIVVPSLQCTDNFNDPCRSCAASYHKISHIWHWNKWMTHDGTPSEHSTCRSIAKTNLCWSSVDHLLLSSFSHIDWNASIVLITRALFSWSPTPATLTSFYFEFFIYSSEFYSRLWLKRISLVIAYLSTFVFVNRKVIY